MRIDQTLAAVVEIARIKDAASSGLGKRDVAFTTDQRISAPNADLGIYSSLTTVEAGVEYALTGTNWHHFYGNVDNYGAIVVDQADSIYPQPAGQTVYWSGSDAQNANLRNFVGASISLIDPTASTAPVYDWYLNSMQNDGTIQFCGRGDTGGSIFQLYCKTNCVNNGLIDYSQIKGNQGVAAVWRNYQLTTAGTIPPTQTITHNGGFLMRNMRVDFVQNYLGTGCWMVGINAVMYLQDGVGYNQIWNNAAPFAGQSISFLDGTGTLHIDSWVYKQNNQFGAAIFGFSQGNAIEFYELIASYAYAGNILTVKLTSGMQISLNIGVGYNDRTFAVKSRTSNYGTYNAIYYNGPAPLSSPPVQCSWTSALCAAPDMTPGSSTGSGLGLGTGVGVGVGIGQGTGVKAPVVSSSLTAVTPATSSSSLSSASSASSSSSSSTSPASTLVKVVAASSSSSSSLSSALPSSTSSVLAAATVGKVVAPSSSSSSTHLNVATTSTTLTYKAASTTSTTALVSHTSTAATLVSSITSSSSPVIVNPAHATVLASTLSSTSTSAGVVAHGAVTSSSSSTILYNSHATTVAAAGNANTKVAAGSSSTVSSSSSSSVAASSATGVNFPASGSGSASCSQASAGTFYLRSSCDNSCLGHYAADDQVYSNAYTSSNNTYDSFYIANGQLYDASTKTLCVASQSGGAYSSLECSNDLDYINGAHVVGGFNAINGAVSYDNSATWYGCGVLDLADNYEPSGLTYSAVNGDPNNCRACTLEMVSDVSLCAGQKAAATTVAAYLPAYTGTA